jgi:thioredoxin-related protein
MPWLSFPFKDQEKMRIAKDFEINGIPAFLVFDKNGKLIDYDGRMSVQMVFQNDSGEEVANQIIEKWNKN